MIDELASIDFPPQWKVVAYPHGVGLCRDLREDLSFVPSSNFSATVGVLGVNLNSTTELNSLFLNSFEPVVVVDDNSDLWKLVVSNVGSYALLGISPSNLILSKKIDLDRRYESFLDYVEQGGVGFGDEGKVFARNEILPLIWRPGSA